MLAKAGHAACNPTRHQIPNFEGPGAKTDGCTFGFAGIMDKKMETTIVCYSKIFGVYWDIIKGWMHFWICASLTSSADNDDRRPAILVS